MDASRRRRAADTGRGRRRLLFACHPQAWSIRSGPVPVADSARIAWAFAALLAFVVQSFVLQTHLHLPAIGRAQVAASATTGLSAPDDDRATCPICRDAAQFGNYLSPATPALPAASAMVAIFDAVSFLRWPPRHASPGWYGRGPPRRSAP